MDAAIVAGIVAAIAGVVTLVLNKTHEIAFEQRKLKQEYYLQYIYSLSRSINAENKEEKIANYHAFNTLLLVASPKVINALYSRQDVLLKHAKSGNKEFDAEVYQSLANLIKEMRLDLYGKRSRNKGVPEELRFLQDISISKVTGDKN